MLFGLELMIQNQLLQELSNLRPQKIIEDFFPDLSIS
jgi:hypothetical protein